MWVITLQVLAFVVKNVALILGIIEAVFKAVSGIISLTPTKRDDKLLPYVDNFFSGIKRALYQLTEIMTK